MTTEGKVRNMVYNDRELMTVEFTNYSKNLSFTKIYEYDN